GGLQPPRAGPQQPVCAGVADCLTAAAIAPYFSSTARRMSDTADSFISARANILVPPTPQDGTTKKRRRDGTTKTRRRPTARVLLDNGHHPGKGITNTFVWMEIQRAKAAAHEEPPNTQD